MNIRAEKEIEQMALQTLQEQGYEIQNGTSIKHQFDKMIFVHRLQTAIDKINPEIPAKVRKDALDSILKIPANNLLSDNERFHKLMTEGIDITGRHDKQTETFKVWLIDFQHPENNDFAAFNQITIVEKKCPNIILFINGLPLVVVVIKRAIDEKADLKDAYNELITYKQTTPALFCYNSFSIITNGWSAKAGTITSDYSDFNNWKIPDTPTHDYTTPFSAKTANTEVDNLLSGMLHKKTIIDLIRNFIVFEKKQDKTIKEIAIYHQYDESRLHKIEFDTPSFDVLSEKFIAKLKNMPGKNLALALLRSSLNDKIEQLSARNTIHSRKFYETLAKVTTQYENNILTTTETIEELIKLAQKIKGKNKEKENLKLDLAVLAFYETLAVNDNTTQILNDTILKTIAKDLVIGIKNCVTLDWDKKESTQAKMRVLIKRTLYKYSYPPEKQQQIVRGIMEQAKLIYNASSSSE